VVELPDVCIRAGDTQLRSAQLEGWPPQLSPHFATGCYLPPRSTFCVQNWSSLRAN
jgi:hypothetical protein